MYALLVDKGGLTITEMSDIDYSIPIKESQVRDAVSSLKEMCYQHNKHLKIASGAVVRYTIEELPVNKLDKLIISLSQDERKEKCVNFLPVLLEWENFPKLVTSEKADSFTCCHYEPSGTAPSGHRKADNFIEEQNLIAFDIDNKLPMDEAKEILKDYTYLMYTTKSHQKPKGITDEVCDRFRILMPTKVKFYVNPEQHKKMYENLETTLGITANDVATRNVSRLFYTNTEAEVFTNTGKLIDVSCCIPDTIISNHVIPNMENINMMEQDGELDRRDAGMMKYAIMNAVEGNRNNMVHNYMMFLIDLNHADTRYKVEYLNAMISVPLDSHELESMLRAKNL